ncbi:MAG: cell division ATP-binding protein FtsE [Lachnospiraceae bacterium]|nr:cell division ATP-binding protein FtsE [Lachnoclostridium sp.]MDD7521973.1 cell division ATP-binding protein FtsE [Lachnoclostridium sp.]MDY2600111.1 cell division ATP-binding protein FtsE [Lachnospiraceae bacterium]
MIKLENIKKTYQENVDALDDISLTINKGEFVFIVGPSGSGKSTLIKLILKQIDATSGKLIVNGKDVSSLKRRQVSKYRRDIGVVFQNFKLLKDRSVFENVALAQRVIGIPKWNMEKNVSAMLSTVGLLDKAKANPKELSGGEQQRVALARALVNRPSVLLADEPTGNLDPKNAWSMMKLLDDINKLGTTVLVVTHNPDVVDIMQKRVITLEKGKILSDRSKGGYTYERN